MAVIDANVAVLALIGSDDAVSAAAANAIGSADVLHAPGHFVSEVVGAIRWHAAGKRITWDDADAAVSAFNALGVKQHSLTTADVDRAWEMRHNITPQDALYIALAERLHETFITHDLKLKSSDQPRCVIAIPALAPEA